jgi:mono/diheme cytochrome c family protein
MGSTGHLIRLAAVIMGVAASGPLAAQQPAAVDFTREVQPILAKHCFQCHGPSDAESGLRLSSRDAALQPADSGLAAMVPGDARASELIRRVSTDEELERMPPDGPGLSAEQIGVLRRWIDQGAPWQDHWAFRPRQTPEPPEVADADWVRNPIDAFILARLEQHGLKPAPPAERLALLRRAHFDLTGLPPTPDAVAEFLADDSPDAFEKVVDRLLDSPHYGERWGRHWLDLVRFAETNSFERDSVKPHAWRYRDYVIRSLNDDKPYDQFLREQLAGDELPSPTADSVIATGFYRLGVWDDEPADRLLATYDHLDDLLTTVGQAFLGLTVNCARCHDHKIDPITQHDYYGLLAFLHNLTPMAKSGPQIEAPIVLADGQTGHALAVSERGPRAPETFVLLRGNPQVRGAAVEPSFPAILDSRPAEIAKSAADAKTSGRRRVLADWIASADNPLTARAMANRIWQHHFGRGIVRSPNNFGQNGLPPTHPELLDWLAGQLIDGGWRLKSMHRLIMLSSTYRMSSQSDAMAFERDPANDLFWRFDLRRLSAEEIRDSVLAINGRLNPQMFGPGFFEEISAEVLAGQSRPGDGWGKSPPEQQARRAVYIHVKRSLLTPLLEAFDLADPDGSCEARFVTTQPAQALAMLNGKFMNDQAAHFASRLRREAPEGAAAQVRRAWQLALGRDPDEANEQRALAVIEALQQHHGVGPDEALNYYCLLVYNLNEFLYLD